MAKTINETGVAYFRPTSDISVNHKCSSGSSAWAMLDEIAADDDSTYIQQVIDSSSETSVSTTVRMTTDKPIPKGATINSVKCYVRGGPNPATSSSSTSCYLSTQFTFTNDSSATATYSSGNIREQKDAYATFSTNISTSTVPESIDALITTRGSTGKSGSYNVRVTQVYVEVNWTHTYIDPRGIYLKKDNNWVEPSKVYQKVNGGWVEVDYTSIDFTKLKFITN